MANNAAGARSVWYGKTIDHVLEMVVALSDGTRCRISARSRAARRRPAIRWKPPVIARCWAWRSEHAGEIDRRYPKILRRVGGYNLDEFTDPAKPVNLAKIMVGSEGTLGIVLEAKLRLVPLPKAKAVMVDHVRRPAGIARRQPGHPAASAIGGRSDGQIHSRLHPPECRRSTAFATPFIEGDPAATLCVEFYADRKEDLPPRLQRAGGRSARAASRLCLSMRNRSGRSRPESGACAEASLGLSMAMKGDAKSISFVEDTAVAPEKLRDFIERFLEILESHGTTAGIYAHASVGCLHVRPVINLKTEDGVRKFEAIAQRGRRPRAGIRRRAFRRARRRPGAQPVQPPDVRPGVLRGVSRKSSAPSIPLGIFNPGKIVDAPPHHLEPALRRGLSHARSAHLVRLLGIRRHGRRGRNVQRRRRLP